MSPIHQRGSNRKVEICETPELDTGKRQKLVVYHLETYAICTYVPDLKLIQKPTKTNNTPVATRSSDSNQTIPIFLLDGSILIRIGGDH